MSGEFQTEIEIEMGQAVFFAFAYEKKSANTWQVLYRFRIFATVITKPMLPKKWKQNNYSSWPFAS